MEIEIPETREVIQTESEEINDILELIAIGREEVINSQSARDPAGLISFDAARLTAVIAKLRAFLALYVAVATPLDQPESSPMVPNTGAGAKGT